MKEARIDAILQSLTKTLLVYLPEVAVEPNVFYEDNLVRRDELGECRPPHIIICTGIGCSCFLRLKKNFFW